MANAHYKGGLSLKLMSTMYVAAMLMGLPRRPPMSTLRHSGCVDSIFVEWLPYSVEQKPQPFG
jgi:hypothetical protein